MRCGNQETCEAYKKYLKVYKDEDLLLSSREAIAESPLGYSHCFAGGESCSVIKTLNLLEKISWTVGVVK